MPDSPGRGAGMIFIRFWLPVLLIMAVIFFISSLPGSDIPGLFSGQDMLYHVLIYLVLASALARALGNSGRRLSKRAVFFLAAALAVFYGCTDEFHQLFVPGRSASGLDIAFNSLGSISGGLIYNWLT